MTLYQRLRAKLHRRQAYDASRQSDLALYRELYPSQSLERRAFYNIGAGGFRHQFWTNVDYVSEWYKDVQRGGALVSWDALSGGPLPLGPDSAEVVYSSHMVEHITNEAAHNLFAESYRILKPGGVVRITTPSIELSLAAFHRRDRHFFTWIERFSEPSVYTRICLRYPMCEASLHQIVLWHFASSASELHCDGATEPISDREFDEILASHPLEESLDVCVSRCSLECQRKYPGNHINWWSSKKLCQFIGDAGFRDVQVSGYGQSRCVVLRNTAYFDCTKPHVSLYVEGIK